MLSGVCFLSVKNREVSNVIVWKLLLIRNLIGTSSLIYEVRKFAFATFSQK